MTWEIILKKQCCPYKIVSGDVLCNKTGGLCHENTCPYILIPDRYDKNTAMLVKAISNLNETLKEILELKK